VADAETEIHSADVSVLTSPGLSELKRLINEAEARRTTLRDALAKSKSRLDRAAARLRFAQFLVVRLFTEKAIPKLVDAANAANEEYEETGAQLEGCFVEVDFAFDEATRNSYAALVRAFEALRACQRIWDITATSEINRVAARTVASTAVKRVPVAFDFFDSEIVRSQYRAMRLGNVAGRDIQIFPGFVMMRDATRDFGLIEFREFECRLAQSHFVEEEAVPSDAEQIGQTWKKANKDGSRDRRFNDNHQIPIVRYGALVLTSPTGLAEAYQISNYDKASAFAQAVAAHKRALANLSSASDVAALPPPSGDIAESAAEEPAPAPSFVAKPRKNLGVDWILLALIVLGSVFGGVWADQHWAELSASVGSVFAGSPPAQATPTVESAPPPTPAKHAARHRTHHRPVVSSSGAPVEATPQTGATRPESSGTEPVASEPQSL
jgi:hypothetical protein